MKKHLFAIFCSLILFCLTANILAATGTANINGSNQVFGQTGIATSANSGQESATSVNNTTSGNLPNILQEYATEKNAKTLLDKILAIWDPINKKGSGWWSKNATSGMRKWLQDRIQNIKNGLQEEKLELQNDFKENSFKFFQDIWQRIREKI